MLAVGRCGNVGVSVDAAADTQRLLLRECGLDAAMVVDKGGWSSWSQYHDGPFVDSVRGDLGQSLVQMTVKSLM